MDRSFVEENASERERLRTLAAHLTDNDLRLRVGNDWTISVAFAHLAFWDTRSVILMQKWKKSGVVEPSPIDVDVTNEALLPLWISIEPRKAVSLAISAAEEIDRELEQAPPDIISQIEALGDKFRLYRSIHRKMHLDQIEEVFSRRDQS